MIFTALVMAAIIALGLYAFFGLQRQEGERLAAVGAEAGQTPSEQPPAAPDTVS